MHRITNGIIHTWRYTYIVLYIVSLFVSPTINNCFHSNQGRRLVVLHVELQYRNLQNEQYGLSSLFSQKSHHNTVKGNDNLGKYCCCKYYTQNSASLIYTSTCFTEMPEFIQANMYVCVKVTSWRFSVSIMHCLKTNLVFYVIW